MIRNYVFTWYENKDTKYRDPLIRTNTINLTKPRGKTEIDTKAALQIFMKNFGNLKRNTLISIKECDENGQIGEDITPSAAEDAIIPMIRRSA